MSNDILSDVLGLVHLNGVLIFRVDICGPWCIAANPTIEKLSPVLARENDHVIAFHIVIEGDCWLRGHQGDWFVAHPGDAVVLPHGGLHRLGDQVRNDAIPFQQMLGERKLTELRHVQFATGENPKISLLCGFLGCDRRAFEPLFASLPSVFRVSLDADSGALIQNAMRQVEDDSPGAQSVRTRLTEVLFMQALRQYVEVLPDDAHGWLAAVRDPVVGRALHAMHEQPCRDWSVQALARQAASSRSRLATRFREVLGQPPMQYLTRLRMQIAARRLHQGACTVAGVAGEVGYDSPAAFQRAFKRHFGVAPGSWRRQGLQSQPGYRA